MSLLPRCLSSAFLNITFSVSFFFSFFFVSGLETRDSFLHQGFLRGFHALPGANKDHPESLLFMPVAAGCERGLPVPSSAGRLFPTQHTLVFAWGFGCSEPLAAPFFCSLSCITQLGKVRSKVGFRGGFMDKERGKRKGGCRVEG